MRSNVKYSRVQGMMCSMTVNIQVIVIVQNRLSEQFVHLQILTNWNFFDRLRQCVNIIGINLRFKFFYET